MGPFQASKHNYKGREGKEHGQPCSVQQRRGLWAADGAERSRKVGPGTLWIHA
jgi:hypothetical protein